MIRSQEIALRCAAAMDSNLLRRNWMDLRRERYMDAFGITTVKVWRTLTRSLMDQLDRCADDEARRILLGVGERFDVPQKFAPVGVSLSVAERVRRAAA